MKLNSCFTRYTQINIKWIKDLNGFRNYKKLQGENMLLDVGLAGDFLYLTPKAKVTKAKINNSNYIKLKNFCTAKEIHKMKRQPREWENMLANHYIS